MKKILIIEDSKLVRDILAWRLGIHMQGCTVLTANDGGEGVRVLEHSPVDLIMTDLVMPVMDGFGVIEYRNRKCSEVPLIVMTGLYTPQVRERLDSLGIKHCFEKPFDFDNVARLMLDLLGGCAGEARRPVGSCSA